MASTAPIVPQPAASYAIRQAGAKPAAWLAVLSAQARYHALDAASHAAWLAYLERPCGDTLAAWTQAADSAQTGYANLAYLQDEVERLEALPPCVLCGSRGAHLPICADVSRALGDPPVTRPTTVGESRTALGPARRRFSSRSVAASAVGRRLSPLVVLLLSSCLVTLACGEVSSPVAPTIPAPPAAGAAPSPEPARGWGELPEDWVRWTVFDGDPQRTTMRWPAGTVLRVYGLPEPLFSACAQGARAAGLPMVAVDAPESSNMAVVLGARLDGGGGAIYADIRYDGDRHILRADLHFADARAMHERAVHECGHAIGLQGHSPRAGTDATASNGAPIFSAWELAAIAQVYARPAGSRQ